VIWTVAILQQSLVTREKVSPQVSPRRLTIDRHVYAIVSVLTTEPRRGGAIQMYERGVVALRDKFLVRRAQRDRAWSISSYG
jgi:hypothetical protein